MPKIEPYRSLEEVRIAKIRARVERDRVQGDLRTHLDQLREPTFRRALMGDAVGDMLQAGQIKLPISTMKLLTDPSTVVVQVIILKEEAAPATGEAATIDATAKPAAAGDKKKDDK